MPKDYKRIKIEELSNIKFSLPINDMEEMREDIRKLIGRWFSSLEDEGCEPFECDDCIQMANKYGYTKEDYKAYLRIIY